jgi:hypothetical protein
MSEQLQSVERKQRRRRGSFESRKRIAARERLQDKLTAAGMDSSDAPKSLMEQGDAIIAEAELLFGFETSVENLQMQASTLSSAVAIEQPMLCAHKRTKAVDAGEVLKLAIIGCSAEEIGVYVGISRQTVCARFGRALEKGRTLRKLLLRQRQTEVALAGNPSMLIWLGKQELGQRNNPLETSSPNGGPVSIIAFLDAIREEKQRRGM